MSSPSPTPLLALLAAILVTTACASPASRSVESGDDADAGARLSALNALDERIGRVAYRLSVNNADLCPTVRRTAGWTLHSANQYSLALRPLAAQRFGLSGDLPGVLAIAPASPAQSAGMQAGDLIVAVAGQALTVGAEGQAPSYTGLAANLRQIDAVLARDEAVDVTARRRGEERAVTVHPIRACGYEVQLDPSGELNARADGRRLFISTALAGFAQSDDEVALILGHELAHHVLGHREWADAGGAGRLSGAPAPVEGGPGGAEQQADRVGLFLMARAGYDPGVGGPFWRRFGDYNWRVRLPQVGHASAGTRARLLDDVAREIADKRASGRDLAP